MGQITINLTYLEPHKLLQITGELISMDPVHFLELGLGILPETLKNDAILCQRCVHSCNDYTSTWLVVVPWALTNSTWNNSSILSMRAPKEHYSLLIIFEIKTWIRNKGGKLSIIEIWIRIEWQYVLLNDLLWSVCRLVPRQDWQFHYKLPTYHWNGM